MSGVPVATDGYAYRGGVLCCGGVDLRQLADVVGTPCYVYDAEGIRGRYASMVSAIARLRGEVRYAVKANANHAVLSLLASCGAGMDVVSIGELERAHRAGVAMDRVCFAGVAKSDDEVRAALDGRFSPLGPVERGSVGLFNVESASEAWRVAAVAEGLGVTAAVALRLNPGVEAGHNAKVRVGGSASKFGMPAEDVITLARALRGAAGVEVVGLHMHVGSQIAELSRFDEALGVYAGVADALEASGVGVRVLDVGAGLAVSYMGEAVPSDTAWGEVLLRHLGRFVERGVRVLIEPGREVVAQAGVLLVRVRHVKQSGGRTFVVTDAGLNALVRPAMYGSRHLVWPVACGAGDGLSPVTPVPERAGHARADVVGPVCESSDVLVRDWPMPAVRRGDVLAVFTAGAYGRSMAMTFNDLPMPAEVMIEGGEARVVAEHQGYAALLGGVESRSVRLGAGGGA